MAGNNLSEPFSPYGYNFNISGFNNYNTSEFNNINSNTSQEIHFASNLNFYAPMDVSYQSPVSFSNSSYFPTSQMYIPGSGLLPYPMFSPFFSLSPGPFLFGFPF
jgi:hypothetical protein